MAICFATIVSGAGSDIAALIDFESASEGRFAYDLAVTLCAWCYSDRFEAALLKAMIAGYCSRRPLHAEERAALAVEGQIAGIRFAITRITDFEMRLKAGQVAPRDFRRFLNRAEAFSAGCLKGLVD